MFLPPDLLYRYFIMWATVLNKGKLKDYYHMTCWNMLFHNRIELSCLPEIEFAINRIGKTFPWNLGLKTYTVCPSLRWFGLFRTTKADGRKTLPSGTVHHDLCLGFIFILHQDWERRQILVGHGGMNTKGACTHRFYCGEHLINGNIHLLCQCLSITSMLSPHFTF